MDFENTFFAGKDFSTIINVRIKIIFELTLFRWKSWKKDTWELRATDKRDLKSKIIWIFILFLKSLSFELSRAFDNQGRRFEPDKNNSNIGIHIFFRIRFVRRIWI